jgi:hypothetical protein
MLEAADGIAYCLSSKPPAAVRVAVAGPDLALSPGGWIHSRPSPQSLGGYPAPQHVLLREGAEPYRFVPAAAAPLGAVCVSERGVPNRETMARDRATPLSRRVKTLDVAADAARECPAPHI